MRLSMVAALVVCACDAQVTSSYQGERMAEIRGNIVSEMPPGAARAALLWWTGAGPVATPAITEGQFPAAFTLSVYRRPPEAVLFELGAAGQADGPALLAPSTAGDDVTCRARAGSSLAPAGGRLGLASIAAVAQEGGAVTGLATGHAVVFVDSGTALPPGYHLMRVEPADAATAALACGADRSFDLRESLQGADGSEVEIRIRAW